MTTDNSDLGLSGECATQENTASKEGYLCRSVDSLVQYLAVSLLPHKYFFYVVTPFGEKEDPAVIDKKMTEKYDTQVSKKIRSRRRASKDKYGHGVANVRYLRVDGAREFLLIATEGRHLFYDKENGEWGPDPEKSRINDVRDGIPIKIGGYSVGYYFYERYRNKKTGKRGRWKSSIRIQAEVYSELKEKMVKWAARGHRDLHWWIHLFRSLPFKEWGGVTTQKYDLLRAVNNVRQQKGWPKIEKDAAISWKRQSEEVFVSQEEIESRARPEPEWIRLARQEGYLVEPGLEPPPPLTAEELATLTEEEVRDRIVLHDAIVSANMLANESEDE